MNNQYSLSLKFTMIFLLAVGISFSSPFVYDQGTNVLNGGALVESANLTIQIWDSATGGTLLWEQNYSNGIMNGSWNVLMDNIDFAEYGHTYYKDYQIDGNDLDFNGNERIAWFSNLGYINSSYINSTNIQLRVSSSCSSGTAIRTINEDGSVVCESTNFTDTSGFNETSSPYLYNVSLVLQFNETMLNQTIDARETVYSAGHGINISANTISLISCAENQTLFWNSTSWNCEYIPAGKSAAGIYLYEDGDYFYLNETLLNSTIDSRSNYTNGSGLVLSGKQFSIIPCSDGQVLYYSASSWGCTALTSTRWIISSSYLYNDSNTLYFNETKLNQTILSTGSVYNESGGIDSLNASKATIGTCPAGYAVQNTTTGGTECIAVLSSYSETDPSWSANASLVRYISEQINASEVNKTTGTNWLNLNLDVILDNIYSWLSSTFNATSSPYLYNDSNTLYFNETALNNTIDARGGSIWENNSADYLTPKAGYSQNINVTGTYYGESFNQIIFTNETKDTAGINAVGEESIFQVNSAIHDWPGQLYTGTYNETTNLTEINLVGFEFQPAIEAALINAEGTYLYVYEYVNESQINVVGNVSWSGGKEWTCKQAPYIDVNGDTNEEIGYSWSRNNQWLWAAYVGSNESFDSSTGLAFSTSELGEIRDVLVLKANGTDSVNVGGNLVMSKDGGYMIFEDGSIQRRGLDIPDNIVHFMEFLGDAVITEYVILGTQTVSSDTDVYGVHNFATGGADGNDAGVSSGGTTTTTNQWYNVSKTQRFQVRMRQVNTNGHRAVVGMIRTSTSQNLLTITDGLFFNMSSDSNWFATACRQGTGCQTIDTGVASDTNYHTFTILPNDDNGLTYIIDNTEIIMDSSYIPTNYISWIGPWIERAGTTSNFRIDYLYFERRR